VSQFEFWGQLTARAKGSARRFLAARNDDVSPTGVAPQDIVLGRTANWRQIRSNFFLNPTTGTLEVRPDARLKVKNALLRETRRMKLRLYMRLALLYFAQFSIECRRHCLQMARLIIGLIAND
jgi:hypothetical protein